MLSDEELNNSRIFDVHRWSEYSGLLEITNTVFAEFNLNGSADYTNRYFRTLRVVLIDLCHLYTKNQYSCIAFHKNNNSFVKKSSRYNKIHITRTYFNAVVCELERTGYIETKNGFYDRRTGGSRISRMWPTERLKELFEEYSRSSVPVFSRNLKEELLILRDKNKCDIEYDETDRTALMRERLQNYNQLLSKAYIDIEMEGYEGDYEIDRDLQTAIFRFPEKIGKNGKTIVTKIDFNSRKVKRIFNNNSWNQGGRFYGGWWQSIPRELRNRIIIGQYLRETVEVDYMAIHVVLLYAIKDISLYKLTDSGKTWDDPYTLSEFGQHEEDRDQYRKLFKLIMLIILNAGDRKQARNAIVKKIYEEMKQGENCTLPLNALECVDDAIDALVKKHHEISEYFFSGKGTWLQNLDSIMAQMVIENMMESGRPVLCIHDSFICNYADLEEVKTYMLLSISQHMPGDYGDNVFEYDCFKVKYQYNKKNEEDYKRWDSKTYLLDKVVIEG